MMGTRNLTAVMLNGEYKVAQYGQWDGYPSGMGLEALDFLSSVNIDEFKLAISECKFLTDSDLETLDDTDWKDTHDHLRRDHGAKVLGLIMNGARELKNQIGFVGDSLFCEYAYVIDLDKSTFEIFEGYNQTVITEGRFTTGMDFLESGDGYHPVKIMKSYPLDSLPDKETFLSDLEPEDED